MLSLHRHGGRQMHRHACRGRLLSSMPMSHLQPCHFQGHSRNFSDVHMQSDLRLMKTHSLDSGVSETLKVVPHRKLLSVAMASRGGGTEKIGNVINLHFEGNWMPIKASPIRHWQ